MKSLRLLLFPFTIVYGLIVLFRNALYDGGLLKSYSIPIKSICVGNLSVGGTGKTPHVDYLLNHFISNNTNCAVLSRGYGRTTKGVVFINDTSTAQDVGDEPLLYKLRYRDKLTALVAENRPDGVKQLLAQYPTTELVVLDDAFQHRAISAGLSIFTTDYSAPFYSDFVLPSGNLREPQSGIDRADIIIITKCPALSEAQKSAVKNRIAFPKEAIFFSHIKYGEFVNFNNTNGTTPQNVLLITGIANPTPLLDHLKERFNVEHISFKDHHVFTASDIHTIHEKFDTFASRDKAIITTEKDFMRLRNIDSVMHRSSDWNYLPISIEIEDEIKFKQLINNYVSEI